MAKKGQAVQLQAEINTDEEWEKLLQRDGLIVVDVYSEWCGSCQGMAANLKKLKLEIGGDMLHLAIAKSDTVTALQRFKNKSEPTWMLISKGKMVNLMFGASAPKLTRLIIDELKLEQAITAGEKERETVWEVTQLSPDEQVRYDAAENIARIAREKEEEKRTKEILERKVAECKNIITNLPGFGVILILPNAKNKYQEILTDLTNEAGLHINQTEKVNMTQENLNELLFFSPNEAEFNEATLEELLNNQSLMLLLKVHVTANIEDIDDVLLTLIYGEPQKPPGAPECVYQVLCDSVEDESSGEVRNLEGIWVPPNPEVRATVLRMFFPKVTKQFEIPEPEPTPPYIAIIFDQKKFNEVLQIMNEFSDEIMHYGFFTDENPETAKLVAQSIRKLEEAESMSKRTFDEKLVIQVAKRKSECILALAQLNPLYMSPNAEEGHNECEKFFPEGYADTVEEEDMDFAAVSVLSTVYEKETEEATQKESGIEGEPVEEQTEEEISEITEEAPEVEKDIEINPAEEIK